MNEKINQRDANGRVHGLWKKNWSNGQPYYEESYIHGKAHGLSRQWSFNNGKLILEGYYVFGKQIGLWKEWNILGKLIEETIYI